MPYRIDPERTALVDGLPRLTVDDLAAARTAATLAAAGGEIDLTGVNITDTAVPGPAGGPDVAVRIYTPVGVPRPTAAVLDIHAGGFIVGGLETDHRANIELSRGLGAVVVSVDYRLAPEHPYPAAIEDCYAALSWMAVKAVSLGVDPGRIAVHGTMAGGGLAAGLALLARDRGGPALCFQYLGVPELDDRLETAGRPAFTDTPGWHLADMVARWSAYLGDGVAGGPDIAVYAAPARAADLAALPPAYISAREVEPQSSRDEGVAYAQRLLAAGVAVELRFPPGTRFPPTSHAPSLAARAAVTGRELTEKVTVLRAALRRDR